MIQRLPNELWSLILRLADIDTRRAWGLLPRKAVLASDVRMVLNRIQRVKWTRHVSRNTEYYTPGFEHFHGSLRLGSGYIFTFHHIHWGYNDDCPSFVIYMNTGGRTWRWQDEGHWRKLSETSDGADSYYSD